MSQQPEETYRLSDLPERFLAALKYRDYRTLWTANMCAGAAAWALIVARGWMAFDITETNSSLWVGVVGTVEWPTTVSLSAKEAVAASHSLLPKPLTNMQSDEKCLL